MAKRGPKVPHHPIIPEPESSDLSARRCWATAQPTDSGTRRLGRGPTPPPWVKVARQVGTLWPWYYRSVFFSLPIALPSPPVIAPPGISSAPIPGAPISGIPAGGSCVLIVRSSLSLSLSPAFSLGLVFAAN